VLYLQPCYSNGHDDTSRSLSHVIAHTSEHGSVHSLLKVSRSFSFLGWLKYCPHCYMFHCSCSSLAWSSSSTTSISQFSSWCCHGLAFARFSMDAPHSCLSFVTTAHTIPRLHHWYGPLLSGCHMSSIGFFAGLPGRFTFITEPGIALEPWRKVIMSCL
jgi:hypothetical protein